mgnify:CR=1 FL=1
MKIKIQKKALLPLLKRAVACTDARSPKEEAKMVRFEAKEGVLTVTATDFFLQFSGWTQATVDKEGACCVEAKGILARVDQMPEGWLLLELGPKKLKLKGHDTRRSYAVEVSAVDYPTLKWGEEVPRLFEMPGSGLADILEAAAWTAETTDTGRPELNVVRLIPMREEVIVEAASGAKGSQVRVKHPTENEGVFPIQLRNTSEMIATCRALGDTLVTVRGNDNSIYLETDGARMGSYLPRVPMINLQGILDGLAPPKGTHHDEVVVNKRAMSEAVGALLVAVDAVDIALYLLVEQGAVHLLASGSGDGHDVVPTASPVTTPRARRFNARNLLDAVKAVKGEDVSITLVPSESHPWLIQETTSWLTQSILLQPMAWDDTSQAVIAFMESRGVTSFTRMAPPAKAGA